MQQVATRATNGSETIDAAGRHLRVVVIGGGMAGLLSVIRLRQLGFHDVTVYEKADRLGGTWRDNTYPGIACDVPSHLYSYSFAPNPDWSHVFSPGAEIHAYLDDVALRYGVLDSFVFGTEVKKLEFAAGRWHITISAERHDVADIIIAATGVLHHPNYPDILGIETFTGQLFHSARWDHTASLDNRRVGIIGTGSSAVQIVGAIVERVAELHLFQRTPQWILPMDNLPISDDDKGRYHAHPDEMAATRAHLAQTFSDTFSSAVIDATSPLLKVIEDLCRNNLEQNVSEPELRERLRPTYQVGCKRLVVAPSFYQAISHPHAHLITEQIAGIEPEGVRTLDGQLHEVDVLVLATGFRVDRFLRPIEVIGADGIRLDDVWSQRPSAYLSISIPGFPNLFMLNGPNGPVGNFSLIDVAELQFDYIMQLLEPVLAGRYRYVAATTTATERFESERTEAATKTVWMTGCRSWYLDDRGIPSAWPWTMDRFRQVMSSPTLDDFEFLN